MLSREDNELLTRTEPGTPMGTLLRRFWVPALLSVELPEPDGTPVRIRIMSEDLIAFRNTDGKVGLVGDHCPHRGASLFYGRNEEGGLRCVYHGWKFDVSGACVDMPNEPPESNFKDKIHHTAYPTVEKGGVVWVYMGPPEKMPELPDLEWARVPAAQRYVYKRWQKSNYAQAIEGGIDSSHVSFLHRDKDRSRVKTIFPTEGSGEQLRYLVADTAPKFELVTTPYGFMVGARRRAEADSYYWRITQFLLPWYSMIPPIGDASIGGHAWVPIDDENCWAFSVNWHPRRDLTAEERAEMEGGGGIFPEKIPGTFRPVRNETNDYQIDRALQRSGASFTGIAGISEQDMACQESMGPIYDRTLEHLGAADAAIIQFRRRLIRLARDLQQGREPEGMGARNYRVRSACVVLPRDTASWPEAARSVTTAEGVGTAPAGR